MQRRQQRGWQLRREGWGWVADAAVWVEQGEQWSAWVLAGVQGATRMAQAISMWWQLSLCLSSWPKGPMSSAPLTAHSEHSGQANLLESRRSKREKHESLRAAPDQSPASFSSHLYRFLLPRLRRRSSSTPRLGRLPSIDSLPVSGLALRVFLSASAGI